MDPPVLVSRIADVAQVRSAPVPDCGGQGRRVASAHPL